MKTDAITSSESKALRLARYLKEFVGLRSTTVYDVNKYESVLWFGDMPQEPECQSPAWNDEFMVDDPWLVVHKQLFFSRESAHLRMDVRKNLYALQCFFLSMIPNNATPPSAIIDHVEGSGTGATTNLGLKLEGLEMGQETAHHS